MEQGIALAGNLIVDTVKYIERYPAPHTLTTISGETRSTGGLVSNCMLTLAKLDPSLPLQAIGLVGKDAAGDFVLQRFAAHPNIDVSGISRQGITSYTDVMTEQRGGSRTFFHYRGANALLSPAHFDFTKLRADILHIGYILLLDMLDAPDPDYPTALCRVLHGAKRAGMQTSVDVVSEDSERFGKLVPPALAYADYCIINEVEAAHTTGIPLRSRDGSIVMQNLQPACAALMNMGVGRWAVIHMPELSCAAERAGSYYQAPSWRIPEGFLKSTVGAGEACASGILYGAYRGWSLAESLRIAGAVAAYSLSGAGATDAIKPLPELLASMEEFQN